jgi:toxin ParE1/3/4
MTLLIVRPLAEADVQEASDWYEEREPGLGSRFVDEVRDTLVRVRHMPLQFPDIGRGMRRALLRRFPYAIYFILRDENRVAILAVLHQHRNPGVWKKRLQKEGRAD